MKKKESWNRTFNAGVKHSKSKPIKVIVQRGEIVHIQHHTGVGGVVVSLVIAITRLGCRIGVALCPHFPQRWILGTRATLQNLKNKQVIKLIVLFYDSHSIDNKTLNKKQKPKNTDLALYNSFFYRHPEFPPGYRCPCPCPVEQLQYEVVNLGSDICHHRLR